MAEEPLWPAGPAPAPGVRVPLPADTVVWERVFTVAPLVIVGTREPDGSPNLAPKHMCMPLGWGEYWCFACTPRHATHANILAHGEFTVSFPRPSQIVEASLAATSRTSDGAKPGLAAIETFPATRVDGVLVAGCYLFLECILDRVVEGFGDNNLIVGRIAAAAADASAMRTRDRDDGDLVYRQPLLAYLSPGRFASVGDSASFPFPVDFSL
jgi:flavin reductase (DIM6/NTAB) family NADH-FMN oxidoreductase RutF